MAAAIVACMRCHNPGRPPTSSIVYDGFRRALTSTCNYPTGNVDWAAVGAAVAAVPGVDAHVRYLAGVGLIDLAAEAGATAVVELWQGMYSKGSCFLGMLCGAFSEHMSLPSDHLVFLLREALEQQQHDPALDIAHAIAKAGEDDNWGGLPDAVYLRTVSEIEHQVMPHSVGVALAVLLQQQIQMCDDDEDGRTHDRVLRRLYDSLEDALGAHIGPDWALMSVAKLRRDLGLPPD